MKDGDSVATMFAGDAGGWTAAKTYMGSNGHAVFTPGTEALTIGTLPAGVSVVRAGLGMEERHGITAFAGKPWHDVRAYGAKGDGTTNDTDAVQAAITAAEAAGSYAVVFSAGTYKITNGGLVCKRETWLIGLGEVSLTMTSTTATLVKWASSAVGSGQGGGAQGIKFVGAGGSSTSIGISFGDPANPSYYAHRLSLLDCELTAFGDGIRIDGPGTITTGQNSATDGFVLRKCEVYSNIYNGMFVRTTFPIEINTIAECHFHNNGTGQPTGAAIQLSASGGGGGTSASAALNVSIFASTFNVNGDGTLGQIHVPASAWIDLKMDGSSFESITLGRTHIAALSDGSGTYNGPRSRVHLTNCYLQHFSLTSYKESVILAAGELHIANTKVTSGAPADFNLTNCNNTSGQPTWTCTSTAGLRPGMPLSGTGMPANAYCKSVESATAFTASANGTGATNVTIAVDALFALIRAGLSGQFTGVTLVNNYLRMVEGTAANRRVLNLALGAQGNTYFASFVNVFDGFGTAASLLINQPAASGDGDLWTTVGDYAAGNGLCVRKLQLQSATDPLLVVPLDLTKIGGYGNIAYMFAANSVAGFLTPIIGSGSLPAAGAGENGKIFIEDNGTGDRNLVIYAGGQRFRIDGGAAF